MEVGSLLAVGGRGPAAAVLIQPLAWEPPYAEGEAQKKKKKKKKKGKKRNNRHKTNHWYLSFVNSLNNGNDRIKRGGRAQLGQKNKRSRTPYPQGQGDPNYTCTERPLWVRKGGSARL